MKNKNKDKTTVISTVNKKEDKTVLINDDISDKTVLVNDDISDKTVLVNDDNSDEINVFETTDNEKRIDSGFYKDPISFEKTIHETDFDIQKLFPGRTKSGHVKINRNFLKDAEPFSLERLNQESKNISEGVFTGFNTLDLLGTITSYRPLLFYGLPRREIVLILLNLLLNLVNNYKNKHFLYYTYSEFRIDMEFKLINALSESSFKNKQNLNTNLKQWINEIGSNALEELIDKVKNKQEYSGLRNFLSLSDRIHIVDGSYGFEDLRDSIKAFSKVFDVGGVIIDNADEIQIKQKTNIEYPKIKYISSIIRKLSLELNFPFFYGFSALNEIKKDVSSNINFINYSTRTINVRKEFSKVYLTDNESGKESVFEIDYDLFKVKET